MDLLHPPELVPSQGANDVGLTASVLLDVGPVNLPKLRITLCDEFLHLLLQLCVLYLELSARLLVPEDQGVVVAVAHVALVRDPPWLRVDYLIMTQYSS